MLTITHFNKQGGLIPFDPCTINSIYIFTLQRLDHALEYDLPLQGENHKYKWLFQKCAEGYNCVLKNK